MFFLVLTTLAFEDLAVKGLLVMWFMVFEDNCTVAGKKNNLHKISYF